MRITRRDLGRLAFTAGGLSLAGCSEIAREISAPELPPRIGETPTDTNDPVWRVLNRMAFGPRPGDVERVREMGIDAYVEEQLAPDRLEENRTAWMRLASLETLGLEATEARDWETSDDTDTVVTPALDYLLRPPLKARTDPGYGPCATELQQACVLRATYGARQLQEVMVDFWTDHFNINQLRGDCAWLKTVDDRSIRRHALGNFRDLLSASAHSPAMLFYLNNDQNRKRDEATGADANENYARELLELHTLGVDGGYTLKDIQEVARCFTGWGLNSGSPGWPGDSRFRFQDGNHDDGPKQVLGVPIPAGQGERDGEQVIELLCRHPGTARSIATRLCRRFVADRGPASLIDRLAAVFRETRGDIRQTLSVLFHSPEFLRGPGRKLKRPFDYSISALRALNVDTTGVGVLPHIARMGQAPYRWPLPDGYPDTAEAWATGLLARWNFALDLVRGKIEDTQVEPEALARATGRTERREVCRALSRVVLGAGVPEDRLEDVAGPGRVEADPTIYQQWLALLLASPQFQWR